MGLLLVLFMNIGAITTSIAGFVVAGIAVAGIITGPIAAIAGLLATVIVIIAIVIILWNMLRVMWMLIKAFANILLLTIFAPFQIAIGTIVPSLSFSTWLKSFVSNLAVFVVTGAMILLMFIFLALGIKTGVGGNFGQIVSNFLFGSLISQGVGGGLTPYWPPLLGLGNTNADLGLLFLAVSFVIFTIIPKANELIQATLSGKPFAYGTSIGELAGPAGSLYGGYAGAQIAGGNIPAPFNRFPALQEQFKKIFPNQEAQRSAGRQVEELFKKPR